MGCANNGKVIEKRKPRPRLLAFLLSFFFSILNLIHPIHAESDVDLQSIPTQLAEALGIPTFGGQILFSGVVMLMFLLPLCLLTRKGRGSWVPEVATTFVIMGACIAIGWLPYWFLLIICMFVALMFSGTMRGLITGRGK